MSLDELVLNPEIVNRQQLQEWIEIHECNLYENFAISKTPASNLAYFMPHDYCEG